MKSFELRQRMALKAKETSEKYKEEKIFIKWKLFYENYL